MGLKGAKCYGVCEPCLLPDPISLCNPPKSCLSSHKATLPADISIATSLTLPISLLHCTPRKPDAVCIRQRLAPHRQAPCLYTVFSFLKYHHCLSYTIYLLVFLPYWKLVPVGQETLLMFLLYPRCLEECPEQSKCSLNTCWKNGEVSESIHQKYTNFGIQNPWNLVLLIHANFN